MENMTDAQGMPAPQPPSAPAPAEAPAAAPAVGFNNAAHAQNFFMNPDAMYEAAQAFLKEGLPEGVQWIARGHQVARENGLMAIQRLMADDPQGALQAWNSSGRFRDAVTATKNQDGKTWTITRKNGQAVTVDPVKEYRATMSPADYFKDLETERRLTLEEQKAKSEAGYRERMAGAAETTAAAHKKQAENDIEKVKLAGQYRESVAKIAAAARESVAELRNETNPQVFSNKLAESLYKRDDIPPEKVPEIVQNATRAQFTYIVPNDDGSYVLAEHRAGERKPVVIAGPYQSHEEASKAKIAWSSGQGLLKPTPKKAEAAAAEGKNAKAAPSGRPRAGSFESYAAGAVEKSRRLPKPPAPDEEPTDPWARAIGGYR